MQCNTTCSIPREVKQNEPVDDEVLVGGLLITDRTHPRGFLLIHLDVKRSVETLEVGTRQRSARDHQTHLPQLDRKQETEG